MKDMPLVDLDRENKSFFRMLEAIESTHDSFLISGKAGTGKSTLLREFTRSTKKSVVVLAPTGLAAIQVGGQTVHSFFGFPFRPMVHGDEEIKKYPAYHPKSKIIRAMDTLVIDEISMLRADLLDAIDASLRLNGGNPFLPFGGKQVILFGDLFQLEPVTSNTDVEQYMYTRVYDSAFFFSSRVFKQAHFHCLELTKIYRQSDVHFIGLLERIRRNDLDYFTLDALNQQVKPEAAKNPNDFTITLCSTNRTASSINDFQLHRLQTPMLTFEGKVKGEFNEHSLPTARHLDLREGAQVVLIKNSPTGKYVNGTIARISKLDVNFLEIEREDGKRIEIEKEIWENNSYTWDRETNRISTVTLGTFTQYPIKLAWAITIHKSQGLTFDKVIIDFGRGAFAHGQVYVALSRCRTLEGITLTQAIRSTDVLVDERVIDFANQFSFDV